MYFCGDLYRNKYLFRAYIIMDETGRRYNAIEYGELLERAKRQDCRAMNLTAETLAKTVEYRDFKATGTEGIPDCKVTSIILPLLADHVLREANHYIRLLETGNRAS